MKHPRPHLSGEPSREALVEADLHVLLTQAVSLLDRLERESGSETVQNTGPYLRQARQKLAVLRVLLSMQEPRIAPGLDPRAPLGHTCNWIDESFDIGPGGSLDVLEGLADLGLLERELFNVVHVCPRCAHCQLNFRESCRSCSSIDVQVEGLIHHFRCAYVGLEHEFAKNLDLVCPKCRQVLHQLGQDFERPHDTYVCADCHYLFEEPVLEGQCLSCEHRFQAGEAESARIHAYRPTPLTLRALELNRLTGLDVNSIMFDDSVQLASRDYLAVQVQRELARIKRYGGEFTCAVLSFHSGSQEFALFREWPAPVLRKLGALLSGALRTLDLVCRLDHARVGLFLPETPAGGAGVVRDRLMQLVGELALSTRAGQGVRPRWAMRTFGAANELESVLAFVDGEA